MESNLKVFESLNCSLCKSPYSKSANSPQSPRQLGCGQAVCMECFEKERPLSKAKRQHQCDGESECYDYPFLIKMLNNPSTIESLNGNGYLLPKNLEVPECPICQEEYLIEVQKSENAQSVSTKESQSQSRGAANESISSIQLADHHCLECLKEFPIEEMFSCSDCDKKICGGCALRKHRTHSLTEVHIEETIRISKETQQTVSIQINGYNTSFLELHKDIVEKIAIFEKALMGEAERIATRKSMEATERECGKCLSFAEKFEEISEEYLPNLRAFDTNLRNLITELESKKISTTKTAKE